MTRKPKRPGTRAGRQVRLPTDIADAAEAALDDMLSRTSDGEDEEPRTQTRAASALEVSEGDVEEEEVLTASRHDETAADRRSKMPLPAPPRTTSVHTLGSPGARGSPPPSAPPPARATPTPPVSRNVVPSPPAGTRSPSPVSRNTVPSPAAGTRAQTPPVRHTPTPPLARPGEPPVHTPTPTPVLPRPHARRELSEVLDSLRPPTQSEMSALAYTSPTLGDLPHSRAELVETAPRFERLGGSLDETARVPTDLPIDFDEPGSADPEEVMAVRSELASLHVAVYEESSQLGSVQSAIGAAGHIVQVVGSGRDGVQRVLAALADDDVDIDVLIVALPGGEPIIEAALAREPRPIVIASLGRNPVDAVNRAYAAGADLVTLRPHDVERLAPILFAAARLYIEKRVALAARGAGRPGVDEVTEPEPRSLLPFDVFQRVLDLEIVRAKRYDYALAVALFAVEIAPPAPPPGIRGILRARAGNALIHSVRDIDFATQLEHERFLVLLPYTDLKGAAGLARRVIAAVAAGDPVVAAGRSFPPRVVGAVAGALPGQALSFDKLMKDATRALDQARRDGAELAVQP